MVFRCFDKLFSALDRKAEGFLKLTDCLLVLSCVHKRFILFIRPDLFSSPILSDMFAEFSDTVREGWRMVPQKTWVSQNFGTISKSRKRF